MTQDHSSKLSFSIEESVWLNKGQEVAEIVSLSLDPEITVQEHGEYVLIRGGLKLTGEYRSSGNSTVSEEDNESLSTQVAFRSIEEVTLNEDGTGEIRHHFPIDVTIPQERIRSLDDIYVIVDSFDYDLPERGCIQLTADVSITGMSTGKVNRDITEADVEAEQEDRTFHYEAYDQERFEHDETIVEFPTAPSLEQEEEVEVEEEEEEVEVEEVEVQVVAEHREELASRSEESEEVAEISEEVEAIAEGTEEVLEVEVEVKR
ncbi:stage VI sporulation protein D [Anaerobacillus sp. CMMVII]|uniref:stage VI sporulation protein D n=1 Tax=Anaerobacillus sp. CMMVII TaxID=2755588 RepID=UPI0021B723F6|nr:stage VI sporulation protein D [Anaerobacillus sp. CMMVII]MCT8137502.1 stage VI sporulation protein D [Anaerobacillus sp. CMMVII]